MPGSAHLLPARLLYIPAFLPKRFLPISTAFPYGQHQTNAPVPFHIRHHIPKWSVCPDSALFSMNISQNPWAFAPAHMSFALYSTGKYLFLIPLYRGSRQNCSLQIRRFLTLPQRKTLQQRNQNIRPEIVIPSACYRNRQTVTQIMCNVSPHQFCHIVFYLPFRTCRQLQAHFACSPTVPAYH